MLMNVIITGHGNICNEMIVSLLVVARIVMRVVACILSVTSFCHFHFSTQPYEI